VWSELLRLDRTHTIVQTPVPLIGLVLDPPPIQSEACVATSLLGTIISVDSDSILRLDPSVWTCFLSGSVCYFEDVFVFILYKHSRKDLRPRRKAASSTYKLESMLCCAGLIDWHGVKMRLEQLDCGRAKSSLHMAKFNQLYS